MKALTPCLDFEHYTDAELLAEMAANDQIHSCIYVRHKEFCIRFMMSRGASKDDAVDIYQDATIVLYEKSRDPQFRLTCSIQTYLNSICYHQLLARSKSAYHKKVMLTDEMDENIQDWFEGNSEEDNEKINRLLAIFEQMKSAGNKCYERLKLFYFRNLSMLEIASRLGFSNADSAKAQIDKCRKSLKQSLGM